MGYEITFKIKEYDEKFKSTRREPSSEENLLIEKMALEGYCLYPEMADGIFRMNAIAKTLMFNLRFYIINLVESWKASKEKEFNDLPSDEKGYKEMYFCGWGFSHEDNSGDTIEYLTARTFEELFFIVITPTPDRFVSEDSNRYESKLNEIKDIFNEIEDSVYDIMNHQFLDFYRDKEDTKIVESY